MSNWQYANDTPTSTWRSAFSLVRKIELKTFPEGVRMVQTPVNQLEQLRQSTKSVSNQVVQPDNQTLSDVSGDTIEIIAEFQLDQNTTADEFGFKVRKGERNETTIGYNRKNASLFVDRSRSGISNFNGEFAKVHAAPLTVQNQKVKMHIFVDRSSVEVFGNEGETVITDQIFPDSSDTGLELYAANGKVTLNSLKVYSLDDVWKNNPFHSNLKDWSAASGSWVDTIDGKQGRGLKESYTMASDTGTDFTYQADIKLSESSIGTGGLVFRSNKDGSKGYVVSVDAISDVIRLYNAANNETIAAYRTPIESNKSYNLKVVTSGSTIQVYVNNNLVITAGNTAYKNGLFGLFVKNDTFRFQNVMVSDASNQSFWGGPFGFVGNYHLWGHKAGSDGRTGVIKCENFILSGDGTISFLLGGGNQIEKQYVALVRASDGVEIFKETGQDTESYRLVTWDASRDLGQELYIKIVDNNTDGFGHLNIDDFHVKN
jgi:fructan beta-fructosidase